jgi:glycerol-1-phosphate dehydrogenase [NAD(P)+]
MCPFAIPEGGPDKLVGLDFECDCGKRHRILVRHVTVKPGAVRDILPTLRRIGLSGRFALIFDKNIRPIAERCLYPVLDRPGVYYDTVCFEKDDEVKAGVESADELAGSIPEHDDFLVVMGSGTMNDLTKYAATKLGKPYVVVPTAPSMNGYTSNISALSENGFKTTQDTEPVAAVIADVDILKEAPIEMIRAGLGDLVSKNVCNADWRLANLLKGTYFCDVPQRLIRVQEKYYFEHARELGARDPEAIRMLAEALISSGFSMSIVGESSPSSGSEHLISHYWEMQQEMSGRARNLHGAQVGVATLIASDLYERMLRLGPDCVDIARAKRGYRTAEDLRPVVREFYGAVAEPTFESTKKKIVPWEVKEKELVKLKVGWAEIWKDVSRFLRPRRELERVLADAGAPIRPRDLGISKQDTFNGIMYSRLMRNRYTILDLAAELGLLETWAKEVAEEFGG